MKKSGVIILNIDDAIINIIESIVYAPVRCQPLA
jgi:hypothetical protein